MSGRHRGRLTTPTKPVTSRRRSERSDSPSDYSASSSSSISSVQEDGYSWSRPRTLLEQVDFKTFVVFEGVKNLPEGIRVSESGDHAGRLRLCIRGFDCPRKEDDCPWTHIDFTDRDTWNRDDDELFAEVAAACGGSDYLTPPDSPRSASAPSPSHSKPHHHSTPSRNQSLSAPPGLRQGYHQYQHHQHAHHSHHHVQAASGLFLGPSAFGNFSSSGLYTGPSPSPHSHSSYWGQQSTYETTTNSSSSSASSSSSSSSVLVIEKELTKMSLERESNISIPHHNHNASNNRGGEGSSREKHLRSPVRNSGERGSNGPVVNGGNGGSWNHVPLIDVRSNMEHPIYLRA